MDGSVPKNGLLIILAVDSIIVKQPQPSKYSSLPIVRLGIHESIYLYS